MKLNDALAKQAEQSSGFPYYKFPSGNDDGTKVLIRPLLSMDQATSVWTHHIGRGQNYKGSHPCLGTQGCPACASKTWGKTQMRGFMPIWNYKGGENGQGRIEMLSGGSTMFKKFQAIAAVYGDVLFRDIVLMRKGTGFKTKYTVYPHVDKATYLEAIENAPEGVQPDIQDVALSGDLEPDPLSQNVVDTIAQELDLEGLTPDNVFNEIASKLEEVCERAIAPNEAQMLAALKAVGEDISAWTDDEDETGVEEDDFDL